MGDETKHTLRKRIPSPLRATRRGRTTNAKFPVLTTSYARMTEHITPDKDLRPFAPKTKRLPINGVILKCAVHVKNCYCHENVAGSVKKKTPTEITNNHKKRCYE